MMFGEDITSCWPTVSRLLCVPNAQLLRERYGIEVQTVALCIVSETLRSYADSYDEVSAAAANHKFRHDVFKECAEVAQSQWELQRAAKLTAQ